MRPIDSETVAAIVDGRRLASWASDFPSEGDKEIAALLSRTGVPTGDDRVFGHRLMLERKTGQVVGGVGFFGPPANGQVEVGYGTVTSRRLRGYATEAVTAMIRHILRQPKVIEVVATADPDNPASIRVLEKAGLTYRSRGERQVTYAVTPLGESVRLRPAPQTRHL
jgi:RimJ/RimL family protein N-acetyltransferase